MFIRHAEKPDAHSRGVSPNGANDEESLTPRGWQRAGALARTFCPRAVGPGDDWLSPAAVFAAGVGQGSHSKRPIETVTPLVELLRESGPVEFVTNRLKDDQQGLIDDVLSRDGVALVCWEHKLIPALIARIPRAPAVPQTWPDDRFDMVWVLDRTQTGWSFSQKPQLLLAGDSPDPIA